MPRKLRHVPEGGSLVEVTCRTVQSRMLLAPRAYVREIVLGVVARAKRLYPVQLVCFSFTSNHYHLLLHVEDAGRMAEFMGYRNGNLAREVRLRGKEPEPRQFATVETLTLDPLPCWKHLPPEEYRQRMADLVAEVVEEARVAREAKGLEPLGADAVRRQQPHTRPNRTKKSPAPLFHAASKKAYLDLREAYSRFVAAFRDAAEKLRAGDRMVAFPEGSFPPALPFVRPAFG